MLIPSKHYRLLKLVTMTIAILSLLLACQFPTKPALNPTPSNNATNVSETTDLSWENGGGATSYDVYFGTNATPDSGESKGNQTGTTFDPGTLSYNTTYYWRIDAKNSAGTTTGTVWQFTTGAPPVSKPTTAKNPAPSNNAINVSETTDLSWENGGGATSYDVYFGTNATPDSGESKGNQIGTTFDPGTLSYSTTYYWRIDAKNSAGTTTGTVWQFTTGAPPVSKPTTAKNPAPSNNAINVSETTDLSWENGGGATSYDVYFGTDATPDSGESIGNQTDTTFDPGTLSYSTTYYWRIDAKNSAGTTTGTVWQFTTGAAPVSKPTAAKNPTPNNNATSISKTIDLSWENGGGATSYDVYFGTDATPDSGESKGNQIGTTFDPGTLSYSTTYYWRIDAKNSAGTTTGTVWQFTTGAPPVSKPTTAKNPAPSNNAINVSETTDLSWENGGGATSYDVYFGTDATPDSGESKGNQIGTTFDPGTLSYSTTYYWRIDAKNSAGTTTGTVWQFTTGTRRISFAGYQWDVRTSNGVKQGPGNNYWADSTDNVWVDSDGLHLRITKSNNKWYCPEVITTKNAKYGINRFSIVGRIDLLDKNVVFAPFLYSDDTHEIDIEFSLWGNSSSSFNTQYIIQPSPYYTDQNMYRFDTSLTGDYTTHFLNWQSTSVRFKSIHGHYSLINDDAPVICDKTLSGRNGYIPIASDNLKVHINLWLYEGVAPSNGEEVEIVIKSVDLSLK